MIALLPLLHSLLNGRSSASARGSLLILGPGERCLALHSAAPPANNVKSCSHRVCWAARRVFGSSSKNLIFAKNLIKKL